SAPLFRSKAGLKRMADKPKFDQWLDDLKLLTDISTGTAYEEETQFQHGIFLMEERIRNDQFAFSGYHHSAKTNRREAKREAKLFKKLTKSESFQEVFKDFEANDREFEK